VRHSGLTGLCGANDIRDVLAGRAAGDEAAGVAFDVYCHRIRKYVGAYHAVLGRVDGIVFTAGVGEHTPEVRAASLEGLEMWGITVDAAQPRRTVDTGDLRDGCASSGMCGADR
jgi:acetate kinase